MSVETPARACGIDFGTSNSTAGWLRPGQPPLLALEDGKVTLPSVIFFNADENTVSVGRAGLNEYLEGYEGRLMRALKSSFRQQPDGRQNRGSRALADLHGIAGSVHRRTQAPG